VEVGDQIDVRDTDYIWCVGTVKMVIESIGNDPILAVHYEGWNMWYDEFLPIGSPRIARLGFYTNRDDIPKYKMRQEANGGQMQAFIINRLPQVSNKTHKNKKKVSEADLANMNEDERRRYENSTLGDGLEDRLEDFFTKHQDANYNNGNF
jgi:hypothetical protein